MRFGGMNENHMPLPMNRRITQREEEAIISYEKALDMMRIIKMECYSSAVVSDGDSLKDGSAFEVMMNMRRKTTKVVRVLNKQTLTQEISKKLRELSPSSPSLPPLLKKPQGDIKDLKRHSRNMYNMACLAFSSNDVDKGIDYLKKSIDASGAVEDPHDGDNLDLSVKFEKLGDMLVEKKENGVGYYKRGLRLVNDLLSADNMMDNERRRGEEVKERLGTKIADFGGMTTVDDVVFDGGRETNDDENGKNGNRTSLVTMTTSSTSTATTSPSTVEATITRTTPANTSNDFSPLESQPPSIPRSPSEPTDDAYLKGCTHLQNEQYSDAIIQFQKSFEINKSKKNVLVSMIHHKWGKSHYGLQEYNEAMERYKLALDENLADDDLKIALESDLGDAYRRLKRYNESLSCYKRALTLQKQHPKDDDGSLSLILRIMTIHRQMAHDSIQNNVVAMTHYRAALAIGYPPTVSIIETRMTQQQPNTTPSQDEMELTNLYISIAKTLGNHLCQSYQYHSALTYFSHVLYIRSNGSHRIVSESSSSTLEVSDEMTMDVATTKAVAVILHNMAVINEKIKCFDMAIELYSRSLSLKREVVSSSPKDDNGGHYIIKTVNCLGYAHYLNGNDDEALEYFKQVKDLLKNKRDKRLSMARDYVHTLNDMAMIYSRKNSTMELEECLSEKKSWNEMISRWESVKVLKKRGMDYCLDDDWSRAVGCFHEAIDDCESLGRLTIESESEEEDLLFFYLGLTMCYAIQGLNEKRLKYYDLFMTIPSDAVETTTTCDDVEKTKEQQQQNRKMTRVALLIQMGRRLLSRRSSSSSSRLSLGDIDRRCVVEGIKYFDTAFNIISSLEQKAIKHDGEEERQDDNYDDLCLALINDIGNAYVILHEEDRAMTFYDRALERAATNVVITDDDGEQQRQQSSCSHVITSKGNDTDYDFSAMEASCYENDNIKNEQQRYYLNTATVHHNLAYLHAKKGTKDEQKRAIELYHSSLQWKAYAMGDNNTIESLSTLVNLGTVEFRLKNHTAALTHLNHALELMNKNQSSSSGKTISLKTATILNKIGNIHGEKQNFQTARIKYTQALALKTRYLKDDHPESLITRHNLGLILSKEGKYEEALKVLREVCHVKLHYLYNDNEENHPDMAKLFLDMATVALMMTKTTTTTTTSDDSRKEEEEEEEGHNIEDRMMAMAREWCERAGKVLDCFELGENHPYVRQWKVCVGMLK